MLSLTCRYCVCECMFNGTAGNFNMKHTLNDFEYAKNLNERFFEMYYRVKYA